MPILHVGAEIDGPVFDHRGPDAVEGFLDEATRAVGQEAWRLVGTALIRYLREPTGAYESHLTAVRTDRHAYQVHADGTAYGYWLAGVGARNYPRTRFRGYPHWSESRHEVTTRLPTIIAPARQALVQRLGG